MRVILVGRALDIQDFKVVHCWIERFSFSDNIGEFITILEDLNWNSNWKI